jgi:glycosyltransferase involved in cell wall biosynthesis
VNTGNSDGPSRNVILIGNYLSHAGVSRSVGEDLAIRLRDRGWKVITTSDKLARIPRLMDILFTIWGRRHEYRVAQIDVYSGLAFTWAEAAGWFLGRLKKPFVITLHGGNLPQFAARRPGRVRRLLRLAHVVTTPSRYLYETMQPYSQKIRLLPNPINFDSYIFRHRTNPGPNLIWLRAFHEVYNPTLAVRSLAQLMTDYPEARLMMIGPDRGDGSLDETKNVARELHVLDRIEFPGGVSKNDVPTWMDKGDIFINTSNVDNTPVSVLEAMACGLMVVSTNVGGIPYLLEDKITALLVPPKNPPAIADAIQRLLTDQDLAQSLVKNARKVVERFDWSAILPEQEKLFIESISPNANQRTEE